MVQRTYEGVGGRAEEWRRLLGSEGDGLRQVFHGLNPERIIGAAGANGMARYALAKAAAYARQRRVWDSPIGAHQGLSHHWRAPRSRSSWRAW